MAGHAQTHAHALVKQHPELETCTFIQNTSENCILYEQQESPIRFSSLSVQFKLPEAFHVCLATQYGSITRLKCEEVWHGSHMAYRCRTCGLSDSSCMCLACFDPEEHEGHDYRVYQCSSGGCCDCGDPLAWKVKGFCKKHRVQPTKTSLNEPLNKTMTVGIEEDTTVRLVVKSVMLFCVQVLIEVHAACSYPLSSKRFNFIDLKRSLPKTGQLRSVFSSALKVQIHRLEQTLSWLQMLSMSCEYYRIVISELFFKKVSMECNEVDTRASVFIVETTTFKDKVEEKTVGSHSTGSMVILDVFLKAGVLLPSKTSDILGVLYLKLLFDQSFKQKYTWHFVTWYPYFIDLYLCASDENNEDGMHNLSRFVERLFCQLFHSDTQLREFETMYASMGSPLEENNVLSACQSHLLMHSTPVPMHLITSSCLEGLMVFLLKKLIDLFRSTLQTITIPFQSILIRGTNAAKSGENTSIQSTETAFKAPQAHRTVQVVDCGHNVFKQRIYARLCSDLRTLLVHPQLAADEVSVYAHSITLFELLQQMNLQTRQIHQHIEYESKNWTFAFVVEYELKLILSAFLSGIPVCFTRDVRSRMTRRNEGRARGFQGRSLREVIETNPFQPLWLAQTILKPHHGPYDVGSDESSPVSSNQVATTTSTRMQLIKDHEQGTGGARAKSLHLPLHHMYAALIHTLCGIVRPQTLEEWRILLDIQTRKDDSSQDVAFWIGVVDFPLQVLLFKREIKAGLWVRNGAGMMHQLTHYHSKHWRYFGLHLDLFLCQMGAMFLPHRTFTRLYFHQVPFQIPMSTLFQRETTSQHRTSLKSSREKRHALNMVEEALRLFLQLILAPVKLATPTSPERAVEWLLKRKMMHWLTLGPFTRTISDHKWAELEEEEILTKVLESVGVYKDPRNRSPSPRSTRRNSLGNYGLNMSGSWTLKPELWDHVSPLFECFTPFEAQQCEQNMRQHRSWKHHVILPQLPRLMLPNVNMHTELAKTMLNSSYCASILFMIFFEKYKESWARQGSDIERGGLNENVLLAALDCLYVAVEMILEDSLDAPCPVIQKEASNWTLDEIAQCFQEESSLAMKLCTEIPFECRHQDGSDTNCAHSKSSLLSLLVWFKEYSNEMEDAQPMLQVILESIARKSSGCLHYLQATLRGNTCQSIPLNLKDLTSKSVYSDESNGENAHDLKSRVKEKIQRRQEPILDRIKSQQTKFLCANSEIVEQEAQKCKHQMTLDAESDSDLNEIEAVEDNNEHDDAREEWGFPTGQVDLCLYFDHVSIAIAQIQENNRQARRRRRRRHGSTTAKKDTKGLDPASFLTQECGLCRLPCNGNSRDDTSFGFVGMILPTKMRQMVQNSSHTIFKNVRSTRLSPERVLDATMRDFRHVEMADCVIWSCHHAIHYSCFDAYIKSLWNQPHGLEASFRTKDRLLSERDMEFRCPICRRLSNCLIPHLPLSKDLQMYQTKGITFPGDEKETFEIDQNPFKFMQWLDYQMRFRDDCLVGTQRHSQTPSPCFRQRSQANSCRLSDARSFQNDTKNIEREIKTFCHAISRCSIRAPLYLSTLLTNSMEEVIAMDSTIQQLCSKWEAQTSTWQVLMQCFEIQVRIVAREKTSLQTDSVDSLQSSSMRQLASISAAAIAISSRSTEAVEHANDKHFKSVMTRLNGLLFGQYVLYEEAQDQGRFNDIPLSDQTMATLIRTPILCHTRLLT
ncbi:hypothetical protein CCR75_002915 [Bremia lactucae]|uniref:E3 ubiquitin-protein ligase n=1 Tax=Bremia lactucae TaxID=4779 RepID=A0A976FQD1_BRELC|nr:hypothetical protein CCR75_002915 [Bremia lactucae]